MILQSREFSLVFFPFLVHKKFQAPASPMASVTLSPSALDLDPTKKGLKFGHKTLGKAITLVARKNHEIKFNMVKAIELDETTNQPKSSHTNWVDSAKHPSIENMMLLLKSELCNPMTIVSPSCPFQPISTTYSLRNKFHFGTKLFSMAFSHPCQIEMWCCTVEKKTLNVDFMFQCRCCHSRTEPYRGQKRQPKQCIPGDSKWPFHPLVGGHQQPLF